MASTSTITKLDLCARALEEVGFATYIYDSTPEQLNSILLRLDSMMATWDGQGLRLGYPLYQNPNDSDINEASNLPLPAIEAVYLNLANRISPSFGKVVTPDAKQIASLAFNSLVSWLAVIPSKGFPDTLPGGAGRNLTQWPYVQGGSATQLTDQNVY